MFDEKIVVAYIVVFLSLFLQPGIKPQLTIDSSFDNVSCSQLREEWKLQVVESMRMQCTLDSKRQTEEGHRLNHDLEKKQLWIQTLENESISQTNESHRLNRDLEKKQLKIETVENESISQVDENRRLNHELEKKQLMIETLENESISQVEENHRLNHELEKKQLKIETLENESIWHADENHRLNFELEMKRLKIKTLENESISLADGNHRLNFELERKLLRIETLENESISQADENQGLNLELVDKQQKIETLLNISIAQTEENHRLYLELENIQQKIETLKNISKKEENQQLSLTLENKQTMLETLENVSNAQAEENQRLNLELANIQQKTETLENSINAQTDEKYRLSRDLETKQLKIETLEDLSSSQSEENKQLKLENERNLLTTHPVTATFISSLQQSQYPCGITKVEDKIYALENRHPYRISVYDELNGFNFIKYITLISTNRPNDIVYSNKSKCVYISSHYENCIWVMTTTEEHRLTKWLINTNGPNTVSLSNEGHLLVLRQRHSISQDNLEIYSLNATLIRRLHLPQDIKEPRHVVQTSAGNFIISHRLNNATGPWVISQLTNDGLLIHRFIPRNQSEEISQSTYLSLDSENNGLFVADTYNNRVILLDSNVLTWSQVLVSKEMNGIRKPIRFFYDVSKKHLFVAQENANVTIYEIS